MKGTSLVVQWLSPNFHCRGQGLDTKIPGWKLRSCSQKKGKKKERMKERNGI